MLNLQDFFLSSNEWGELEQADYKKDYLVYAFSLNKRQWGFQPVFGHEEYLYICEVPIEVGDYPAVRPEPNPDDALEKGSESSLDPIVSSFIYF
jgi:hypothetical protein